jgi:hypothetical protein
MFIISGTKTVKHRALNVKLDKNFLKMIFIVDKKYKKKHCIVTG